MPYKRFQKDKLLAPLSTFGIGGPSRYFIEVTTFAEMQEVVCQCKRDGLPYLILGKGSNVLFDDQGFNGLVVHNKIHFCELNENVAYVSGGYSFALLGVQTARKGLSGLEFASGIPASVGGAVFMNAGANGFETAQTLKEVTYVDEWGDLHVLPKEKLKFGYRTSSFQEKKGAIVAARFELTSSLDARKNQLKIVDYRTQTQPYGEKSAGCIFRNPGKEAAGALIQQCGLKGVSIGGAEVSLLHANFIVNKGNATAQDVRDLANFVKNSVLEKTGVELIMEICQVPYVT